MKDSKLKIIKSIQQELEELKTSKHFFSTPHDFTRDRVFTFETMFYLIADLPRKSLSVELADGLEKINGLLGKEEQGTKGGFSKARRKIKAELFEHLSNHLIELYYQETIEEELKTWQGFILKAVDGSSVDMINTEEIKAAFGEQSNQHGSVAQARMMIGYDVLNGIILNSHLGQLSVGEGTVAKQWIATSDERQLSIYDRLFPGSSLQYLHHHYKRHYVMRCKLGHNKKVSAFVESGQLECIQDWELAKDTVTELRKLGLEVCGKTTFPVRLIRVELEDGQTEVLLTSLIEDTKFPHEIFKGLYHKRWGVEVNIGFLKNTLQIEISSGKTVQAVYQDFHATIFRANVQSLLEQECESEIKAINSRRRYQYKINKTVVAGVLKGRLAPIFIEPDNASHTDKLMQLFMKNLEPMRLGRQFPRIKKSQKLSGKYRPMKNYKRAI